MPLMILLFTVIPALELYFLFAIGGVIGGFNTIMIIILTGVLGATLAKSQGLAILMKIQNEVNQGHLPGKQIIHGLMVFAGGLLLLTPGFMTDILGFSLVMPGTRHLLFGWVSMIIEKGMQSGNIKFYNFGSSSQNYYQYTSRNNETHSQHINQEVAPGVFEAEFEEKKD